MVVLEKRNFQTSHQFIQKLSSYFEQEISYISSFNGLNCNTFNSYEIINLIINKDKNINYDLLFHNIFICNDKINKYINHDELSKLSYNDNLEGIQILLRILSKKRIKDFLINDINLISSIDKSINDFKNIFTKIKEINLITDKNNYPHAFKDTSCQVYRIQYDNDDIFYFKNTYRILKNNNPQRLLINPSLKNSQLRPSLIGLKDKYSKKQLIRLLQLKLNKITSNSEIKNILSIILKNINNPIKIDNLNELLSKISIEDEKSIFRDFGEILGSLIVCDDQSKIYFSSHNDKLIDFIIEKEDQKKFYSCKFSSSSKSPKGGSRSSLSIIKDYMKIFESSLNEEQKKLYQLLNIICNTRGALNSYIEIAKFLKISDLCENELNKYKEEDRSKGRKTYVYASNCKKFLNNSEYKIILNNVLNTINIEQIYLIYNEKDTISFDIKNFNSSNFIFDTAVSVNKNNCKLSFRMK